MASDYSKVLRPPCKSRSAEFYGGDYNNTMSILVTDPWPMSQSISNFYSTNYPFNSTSKNNDISRNCASNNGSPTRGFNSAISMPSYVLVAPTSCCCDTVMEPRVTRKPPPHPPPVVREPSQVHLTKHTERPASTPTCVPWLKKIKVLKKIQRKIRIGSRGGGPSMSNLPPLLFNTIHGENINITDNGTVARRVSSFCKAIVFSDRPVKIHEKVCIKFLEVSTNWSGVLRFGFTNNDPSTLRSCLPRYACPDLTAKSGFWAKAFSDVHVKKDAILYYYVNQAGDVHFGINGEDKGVFFSGVDTRGLLWALIDIYGNTTALEFVDIRAHLNNSRRSITDTNSSVVNDVNTTLVPSVNAMSIGGTSSFMEKFPEIRYYPNTVRGSLLFHRTKGQHAEIGVYRCMAWRRTNEYSNGYVFTATPIQPGEGVVIQVLQSDLEFASSMAFGLTACDPDTIQSVVLPDDSHFLLDRPEYWVVKKDAANSPAAGDELCFTITYSGEVLMSKNGHAASTLMHVDNSIPLWAFFDLYGTTTKIFLLGKVPAPAPPRPAETRMVPQRTNLIASSSSVTSVPHSVLEPTTANYLPAGLRPIPRSQSSTLPGGALTNLSTFSSNPSYESSFHSPAPSAPAPSMDRLVPNGNFNSNGTPAVTTTGAREVQGVASPPYSTPSRDLHNNWSVECVICCERPVDSVFYSCGHMCMCYQCATDYWKTKDKGWCPICRATITDVIRTYKS